jgi:hypothetical protein
MIGSPALPAIIVLLYIFVLPESPRWCIGRGHRIFDSNEPKAQKLFREAFRAYRRLRHTKLQAASEMFLVYHQLEAEHNQKKHAAISWYTTGVSEIWKSRRNGRAFVASLTCMFAQQFW